MRIPLILLTLFTGFIFVIFLQGYLEEQTETQTFTAKAYNTQLPDNKNAIITDGMLFYPAAFWEETDSGRMKKVFIPVIDADSDVENETPTVYLVSSKSDDIALIKELKNTTDETFDTFFKSNLFRLMVPFDTLQVRTTSAPSWSHDDLPSNAVFLKKSNGKKASFPTITLSLFAAALFLLVTDWREKRTLINIGGENITIVGLTTEESEKLPELLNAGAKLVIYQYCISVLLMTFRRPSSVYLIRPGRNRFLTGLHCSFVSLFLGWWGFPWGPIYTIQTLWTNTTGGKEVPLDFHASQKSETPPASPETPAV